MSTSKYLSGYWFTLGVMSGALLAIGAVEALHYLDPTPAHAVEESKLCSLALSEHSEDLHPQTREYLKARLYWNASVWVRPGWMHGWEIDFGPVDYSSLAWMSSIKDGTFTVDQYRDALSKHANPPEPR